MQKIDKRIINEAVDSVLNEFILAEAKKSKKKPKKKKDSLNKRKTVLNWLKNGSINNADIARKLWHPTKRKEAATRSYFYKCRDGKLNDDGNPYAFTSSDINKLYGIKSSMS